MTALVPRRPMTSAEVDLTRALTRCHFPVASFSKRFARGLRYQAEAPEPMITENQAACLRRQVAIYRRQIPAASIPAECRYLLSASAAERLSSRAIAPVPPPAPLEPLPLFDTEIE